MSTKKKTSGKKVDPVVREIPLAAEIMAGSDPKLDTQTRKGVRKPRDWQNKAYARIGGVKYRIIVGPTGCGKSTLIRLCARRDALKGKKVLIVVPQLVIADSYGPVKIQLLDGTVFFWEVLHNFADNDASSVDRLIEFVQSPPAGVVEERIALCSHQTLVMAHAKLMKIDGAETSSLSPWSVFGEVSLFVDEAHHARDGDEAARSKAAKPNALQTVIRHWIDRNVGPLCLTTATWMRGDFRDIVASKHFHLFKKGYFALSPEDYLRWMVWLRKVTIRFFVGDPEQAVANIITERNVKTILYLPYLEHFYVQNQPTERIDKKFEVLRKFQSVVGPFNRRGPFDRHQVGRGFRLSADLVTDEVLDAPINGNGKRAKDYSNRSATYAALQAGIRTDASLVDDAHAYAFRLLGNASTEEQANCIVVRLNEQKTLTSYTLPDIIFAQNMCKEGWDFPALERAIVIGDRGSMVELLQMLGRLLRDYPGKEGVEFNIVLPYNGKASPEQVQRYFNYIMSCMTIEDMFQEPDMSDMTPEEKEGVDKVRSDPELLATAVRTTAGLLVSSGNAPTPHEPDDGLDPSPPALPAPPPKSEPKGGSKPEPKPDDKIRGLARAGTMKLLRGRGMTPGQARGATKHIERLFSRKSQKLMGIASGMPDGAAVAGSIMDGLQVFVTSFGYQDLRAFREALGRKEPFSEEVIAQEVFLFRCLAFQEDGENVDPRTIPGALELFGAKAEATFREVGLL